MDSTSGREPTVHELFDLTGKVALITGGTGHLGSAMSRALAEAGASVVLTSRDAARARMAAESLPRVEAARHLGIALDHMDPASIERGFDEALGLAGRIDVLVNNGHEALADDWTTVTAEQFTRHLANATGYFLLARLTRDHAVGRGAPASIILLGSMYGLVGLLPRRLRGRLPGQPRRLPRPEGGHRPDDPAPGRLLGRATASASTASAPARSPARRPRRRWSSGSATKLPMKRMGSPSRAERRGRLPRERRQQLHDRPEPGHRRRLDGVVTPDPSGGK